MEEKIIIVDEQGKEYEYKITLTFDYEEKEYAIVTMDDVDYHVFEYKEDTKEILPVEDELVIEHAEEILNTIYPLEEGENV